MRSKYVADLVHDAVEEARKATQRAAKAGAKALEAAERGFDTTTSAFIAWAAKHDIDVTDRAGDELHLEFGVVKDIKRKLREGFELWTEADMPGTRYWMAQVRYRKEIDSGLRTIDGSETKSFATVAWRHID